MRAGDESEASDTPGRVRGRYSIHRRPASSNEYGSGGPTSDNSSPAAADIEVAKEDVTGKA
ncbi:hypothetical protein GCM10009687_66950 [Asanoa iriomotensis]|uniref:Uncharacterized protein n=1 Tax=Asanoa iriomotensis TaxID=234613 RepID=A0ABQ4C4B2_9ACTN|nr:hypothetical protein Air01nite_36920 [Asanoa iriomotensis]